MHQTLEQIKFAYIFNGKHHTFKELTLNSQIEQKFSKVMQKFFVTTHDNYTQYLVACPLQEWTASKRLLYDEARLLHTVFEIFQAFFRARSPRFEGCLSPILIYNLFPKIFYWIKVGRLNRPLNNNDTVPVEPLGRLP